MRESWVFISAVFAVCIAGDVQKIKKKAGNDNESSELKWVANLKFMVSWYINEVIKKSGKNF